MNIRTENDSTALREIGELVKQACPPGMGFALFVAGPHGAYVYNCDRADVADSVREWIRRMATKITRARDGRTCGAMNREQVPGDLAAQTQLVTLCAILGDGIEKAWSLGTGREPLSLFFLFEPGGPRKLTAWRAHGRPRAIVALLESWLFRLDTPATAPGGNA